MTTKELTRRSLYSVRRVDRVWLFIILMIITLALLDTPQTVPTVTFAIYAVLQTAPFMILAIVAIGFLKATGSEKLVAQAFQGNERKMIVLASLVGGMAPFCSCEVIPFIAALLAAGTPLSAVMAFWLASPIMDPSIFLITAAELGWEFAAAKTLVAVTLGMSAGFLIHFVVRAGYFQNVLLEKSGRSCGCGVSTPYSGQPVWKFWRHSERVKIFRSEFISNGLFLLKWLSLAYLIESLMINYIAVSTIASVVGGQGIQPIIIGAFVGAPAYLNGYAAPAIVSGLMEHGMSPGAAMSFMVAGGITSIPAMTAVYALVRKQLFFTYLGLGVAGAILSGVFFDTYLRWFS